MNARQLVEQEVFTGDAARKMAQKIVNKSKREFSGEWKYAYDRISRTDTNRREWHLITLASMILDQYGIQRSSDVGTEIWRLVVNK